jgi:AsmA protein
MKWNSGRLWLRILVYGLGSLAALFLLGQALIFWQFDEQAARRILEKSLADAHRVVQVEGHIAPRVFPSPGLKVEAITISDPDGKTPFAHVGEMEIGFAWIPLLLGDKEVISADLNHFAVELTRDRKGQLSIADLLRRRAREGVAIKLNKLKLRDGDIRFYDEAKASRWHMSALNLDASGLRSNASLSAGARLETDRYSLSLAVNTPLVIQDDQVSLSGFESVAKTQLIGSGENKLTVGGDFKLNFTTLQISGTDVNLALVRQTPQAELNVELPTLTANFDETNIPSAKLQGEMKQDRSAYRFNGKLDNIRLQGPTLSADRMAGNLTWQAGPHTLAMQASAPFRLTDHKALRMEPLTMTARLTTSSLPRGQLVAAVAGMLEGDLDQALFNMRLSGRLDGSDLAADIHQIGFVKPHHEVTLSVGKLDLNRYLPETSSGPTQTKVALLQDNHPLSLDWLDFLDVSGRISVGELAMGRFKVNGVQADVTATPEELSVKGLSAKIYEGELVGEAKLERGQGQPHKLELDQTLKGMSIRPLLIDLFDFPRVEGHGSGQVKVKTEGNTFAEFRNGLNGEVQMGLNNGALTGIDLVAALKNLPAELKELNNKSVNAQKDQRTTFSTLASHMNFQKGVARNTDLKLASQLMNVSGGGKLDLVKNIIDYNLDVRANPKEFSSLEGVNVPLKITGPINSPVYALDFNALVKGKKTQVEKQQTLKQELKKQITTILP